MTEDPQPLQEALQAYAEAFEAGRSMTAAKLGLIERGQDQRSEADQALSDRLFSVLTLVETDERRRARNRAGCSMFSCSS
jgi:hypothetical protein